MRLIDADSLVVSLTFSEMAKQWNVQELRAILQIVNEMPTIESERKKGRWIPCEERLPEDERRVLCTVQSGEHYCVVPCIFIQHTRRWLPEVHGNHDNVLAWMPLPEPYKGEEE